MNTIDQSVSTRPRISVVMANFEAGKKIIPALRSVLDQSTGDLEVIVSDDASRDESLTLVREMMKSDPRIKLIANPDNRGPAHCRNQALELAKGEWVAVVDSDDIIHPERFERLLAVAAQQNADIVADDLMLFFEDGSAPRQMLGERAGGSFSVSASDWVLSGLDGTPALGYLKPLIRADRLQRLRYDEHLRIGEDYDFVLRLLLAGARLVVVPEPFYLYRRHSGSISHRLSVADMQAMVAREEALALSQQALPAELATAFARRLAVLKSGLAYEDLVASIKRRTIAKALGILLRQPALLHRLWASALEGSRRRMGPSPQEPLPEVIAIGGRHSDGADYVVPDYVPAHQVDWSRPPAHSVWRRLAAHANRRCIVLDEAGQYASGFIPEAVLEGRQAVRLAS